MADKLSEPWPCKPEPCLAVTASSLRSRGPYGAERETQRSDPGEGNLSFLWSVMAHDTVLG